MAMHRMTFGTSEIACSPVTSLASVAFEPQYIEAAVRVEKSTRRWS